MAQRPTVTQMSRKFESHAFTHMMYQSKSTTPYPAWIPAEALIPFSCYAFDRP